MMLACCEYDAIPSFVLLYKFTGKERDSESGLDYFGARYYSSTVGRWISPDWASHPEAVPYASLGDPQSLNLYSYVGNNPLNKSDPDGHCPECIAWFISWINQGIARDGSAKAFAKNVGVGLGKGAGQAGVGVAGGLAMQAGIPAGRVLMSHKMQKAAAAVTPSNVTQAQVAPVGSALASAAMGAGIGAAAGAAGGAEAGVANALPATVARVIPADITPTMLAAPWADDAFVTNPAAIQGMTSGQISNALTIPESPSGFNVIEFPTPEGIASPINRTNPGFVGGDQTAGGAPEFVVPNGPIPPNSTTTYVP